MILKAILALIPSILRPSGTIESLTVPALVGHNKTKWSAIVTSTLAVLSYYGYQIPNVWFEWIVVVGGVLTSLYAKSTLPVKYRQ